MLSLTTRQQALIDSEYKIANWLVIVTDINNNRYYWSTRNVPNTEEHGDFLKWDSAIEWDSAVKWDNGGDNIDASNAFNFKIIDWPGITLRRGGAESGILAPNDLDFTITNKNSALTADDFIGGTVWVHLSIGDNDGAEIFHRWRFKVKKATPIHQKIKFFCQDFIQEYLRTDYPNEKLIDNIFPSDDQKDKDNLCVPIPFGVAYVPLRSVYITDQRYYLLGPASYTYTISAVHSPSELPTSEWTSPDYTFTQSTKADGDAVDWRVFQPIIADSDNDGVADASGLFKSGDVFLDMPTRFSRSDTVNITNPAYVIKFILEDLGIAVNDINAASFATAAITYASWGLTFNGAIFYTQPAIDVLTQLLGMCNSILISGEQIELHVLSATTVKTVTSVLKPRDVSEAIFSYTDISDETDYDSAYAAFQESNKPQDKLIKIPVPAKSSYDYPSDEIFEMPFIQDSQHVQKVTCLKLQRKYLKKANIDFGSKGHLLALLPDDAITISDANYGGTYPALIEEIHIHKDLQLSISCIRFKETLDNWDDLSFSSVSIAADDSTDFWTPIIAGPDSPLTGNEIPNQLRGRLRIGQTGNYILLDPAEPIIKLYEGGVDRLLIGDLGTDNYGIQINDASGNTILKIDSSTQVMSGWDLTETTISKNNALLDSAGKLELGTGNDIIILSAIDATYRLAIGHATYASAPFRVTKAGALVATSATISGAITGATIDIGGADATSFHVDINGNIWSGAATYNIATNPFAVSSAGVLRAVSGIIGGWTLASDKISITGIELDEGNNRIRVYTGANYVDLTAAGLTGYDSVLGTVFRIFTDGSAPEFSSGIIKECEYQIYTSGVIRTNTDPAANGGLLINNTEIKGYSSTPTLLLKLVYDGTDEGDAYFGDYDSGNAGIKYDHSTGKLYLRSGATADALIIEGGGNVKIESGGDIILHSATGGNSAELQLHGNTRTYYMGIDYDNDRLCIYPDTAGEGYLYIGFDIAASSKPFNNISIRADIKTEIEAYTDSTHYARVYPDVSGEPAAKLGARNGGVESVAFLKQDYFYSSEKIGIGKIPESPLDINLSTEDLEIVDAGSAAASEQDWVQVEVGGNTGYIRIYAAK